MSFSKTDTGETPDLGKKNHAGLAAWLREVLI
jgi:hypothetical protein